MLFRSRERAQKEASRLAKRHACFVLVVGDRRKIEPELSKLPFRRICLLSTDGGILEATPAGP